MICRGRKIAWHFKPEIGFFTRKDRYCEKCKENTTLIIGKGFECEDGYFTFPYRESCKCRFENFTGKFKEN